MIQFQLKSARRLKFFAAATLAIGVQAQTPRLRVAVYPFNQANVASIIQREGIGNVNYGQVAADLLVGQLVSQVDVINRDQMQRLLEEQGRRYDERFDPSKAPEFGKLLGVDAIVSGSITTLSLEQHSASGPGGVGRAIGGALKRLPDVTAESTTVTAKVQLAADVISATTGRILASYHGEGAVKKQIAGKIQIDNQGPTGNSTSKIGYDPYLRQALQDAVSKIGSQFSSVYASVPRAPNVAPVGATTNPPEPKAERDYVALPDEVGNVFKVDGDTMTFFVAPGAKIASGDILEVQHPEIARNPRTGKPAAIGQALGHLKVSQVSGDTGRGNYEGKPATDQDRLVKPQAVAPGPDQKPMSVK
jgi:curli biogenesis system outer membrane secretion channel CsgG